MAILSGTAGKHSRRRETVLRGENQNSRFSAFPLLRVTGVVRPHGEGKKNQK
jgi:hypothetical protein